MSEVFIAEVKSCSSFSISSFSGKDDTENVEYDDMENDPSSDGVEKVYLDMLNLALSEFSESEKHTNMAVEFSTVLATENVFFPHMRRKQNVCSQHSLQGYLLFVAKYRLSVQCRSQK